MDNVTIGRNCNTMKRYHHFHVDFPWRITEIRDVGESTIVTIVNDFGAGYIARIEYNERAGRE